MRPTYFAVLAVVGPTLAARPISLAWSNDPRFGVNNSHAPYENTYGPDGPWQAVLVEVGNFPGLSGRVSERSFGSSDQGLPVPLYPCGASVTQLLPPGHGGRYSISGRNASTTVRLKHDSEGNPDDWFASPILNSWSLGTGAWDIVQFVGKNDEDLPLANGTMFVATQGWNISLPKGRSYNNQIGVLGLGRPSDMPTMNPISASPSMLDQLKTSGEIDSSSFGLHIGSVSQRIPGSLVLGGYDASRLIGSSGVFQYVTGMPVAALVDVTLGAARCDTPFTPGSLKRLYKGVGDNRAAESIVKYLGAPKGSAILIPNPAYPYIALPLDTCEAVASHLPVTWNSDIGFYTWNRKDPRYPEIIKSSAYMEFILSDTAARNVSIKVPFSLLNLTLDTPIVDIPTPYFPCRPLNSTWGFWALGRAFLQAALLGINYDQNKTFLAQAPGPIHNESMLQPIYSTDGSLKGTEPDDLGAFIASWQQTWNSPACSSVQFASSKPSSNGVDEAVSAVGIFAIVFNPVVAAAAIAMALFLGTRRRRSRAPFISPFTIFAEPLLALHEKEVFVDAVNGSDMRKSEAQMRG